MQPQNSQYLSLLVALILTVVLVGAVAAGASESAFSEGTHFESSEEGDLELFTQTLDSGESLGPNLLDNPSCVADGQGEGEEPIDWTVEQGELECNEPEPDFMPDPIEGEYVFIDWEDLEPTTDTSIATQTVPVTGGLEYQFSVWVGSDEVENDYAQFEVQFLDDGTLIGDGMIDSGEFQPDDPEEPDQFVETTVAPADADEAIVRIKLVNGGDFGLDRPLLWADDVRLQEFSDAPTAFDVSGVEMGIEQTLDPDWTLFDDDFGEDEDDRGFDDEGVIGSFGGGDLGGSVTDNDAGDTVSLAGGDLQVNADGTFSLTNPTQTGMYQFDYRLEYEGDHDDATVENVGGATGTQPVEFRETTELNRYGNDRGVVEVDGLLVAIFDWRNDVLSTSELMGVIDAWRDGENIDGDVIEVWELTLDGGEENAYTFTDDPAGSEEVEYRVRTEDDGVLVTVELT